MSNEAGKLGPTERVEALARLEAETFDVLVVGGGVTGAGAALDAATRGLKVALIEKRDFAAGTSSRSSKLIHGGLRYLQQRNFGLVREALHERKLLLRTIAPHLVRPLPFLFPLRHRAWERAYVGAGIGIYDLLGGLRPPVPRHRHLSRRSTLALAPALDGDGLTGAVRYFDACTDDARLVIALVRTAVAHGTQAVAGVRVESLSEDDGRVREVVLQDTERGRSITARARVVVNAGGIWAGEIERRAGVETPLQLRLSKGVHLLLPRRLIDSSEALVLRTRGSVLFVIPWGAHWIVGTTDTEWALDRDHPVAARKDLDYLLAQLNSILSTPVTRTDIVGVYAGLRPLLPRIGASTTQLSRQHVVRRAARGLVTVAGGKYTTYRLMAKDAIDAAGSELGEPVDHTRTADTPLVGAAGVELARSRAQSHPIARRLADDAVERLLARHGAAAIALLDEMASRPELAAPVPGAPSYLLGEIAHAVTHEAAVHLDDVLTRRTRISIETSDRGRCAAEHVGAIMASELGWDDATVRDEVLRYGARLDAELEAEDMPDDERADAIRGRVRDPRLLA